MGDTTNRKRSALLIQLRWLAVGGQIATIAFVQAWLDIALPLVPMACVIGALIVPNFRPRTLSEIMPRSATANCSPR